MILSGLSRFALYGIAHVCMLASRALLTGAEAMRALSRRALTAAGPPPEWKPRLWQRDHDPRSEEQDRRS